MAIDLHEHPRSDHRERVFGSLDELDSGEALDVEIDRELDVILHHYEMKRDVRLEWQQDQPSSSTWTYQITKGDRFEEAEFPEFDVREMPPRRRHEVLLDTFDYLDPGEGFVLVNDHDPKPLYHELRSTRGETFRWEYERRDSTAWKVEIVKTDTSTSPDDDIITRYDVRNIPKEERHPTIHHRYGMIPGGGTMEIVAPHEPQPLHREFQQQYGDSFDWEVVEDEPGRCRVQITKAGESDDASAVDTTGQSGHTDHSSSDDDAEQGDQTESLSITDELDVRDLPTAKRHERIFSAYDGLQRSEGFVLVNDHDPKPLYHQFTAEAGDEFHWEYLQEEPNEFRVLIGKSQPEDPDVSNESSGAPF